MRGPTIETGRAYQAPSFGSTFASGAAALCVLGAVGAVAGFEKRRGKAAPDTVESD